MMYPRPKLTIYCESFDEYRQAQEKAFSRGYNWKGVWKGNVQCQNGDKPTCLYLMNDSSLGWSKKQSHGFIKGSYCKVKLWERLRLIILFIKYKTER